VTGEDGRQLGEVPAAHHDRVVARGSVARMKPLRLIETSPAAFRLELATGTTKVDDRVRELGHEPNGEFWTGLAQFLISTDAPTLEGRFDYDPEAGTFIAFGRDRAALENLGALLAAVANDTERAKAVILAAEAQGFQFDD